MSGRGAALTQGDPPCPRISLKSASEMANCSTFPSSSQITAQCPSGAFAQHRPVTDALDTNLAVLVLLADRGLSAGEIHLGPSNP